MWVELYHNKFARMAPIGSHLFPSPPTQRKYSITSLSCLSLAFSQTLLWNQNRASQKHNHGLYSYHGIHGRNRGNGTQTKFTEREEGRYDRSGESDKYLMRIYLPIHFKGLGSHPGGPFLPLFLQIRLDTET
ncbi:hypothetical protein CEXT_592101 [Caerostris extrusa]|uniref:Uncharacterized protein n=1 Tax=Caerostris extrusa TaxID=172846 RepID=A0AAV4VX15_CAEEX|nr:hypothetical protein CEXT_592101 [Caerostris extrusa]